MFAHPKYRKSDVQVTALESMEAVILQQEFVLALKVGLVKIARKKFGKNRLENQSDLHNFLIKS